MSASEFLCDLCRAPVTRGFSFTIAQLCVSCGTRWEAAPEAKRLALISSSLFSEWVERERCEKLVDKVRQEEERAALEVKANGESSAHSAPEEKKS